MHLARMAVLMVFIGCATTLETGGPETAGSNSAPSPNAKPAVKKELPWLSVTGGRMRTTLFYGPWQCRQQFMNDCTRQCTEEGYILMGCMWLADVKLDWEGSLIALPLPVKAGSRYGVYHCCCNYPKLTPTQKKPLRDAWDRVRDSFRRDWSKTFGEWPEDDGALWPCHHIRDLQHGGDPVDPNNLFPAQPGSHKIFNEQYPVCYDGQAPWNAVGADLPYTDN